MTNRDDLPPDDELASAYVDGELDASGRARVESDPVLLAEVAALRGIRAAVADLPTPELDRARRDAAIKAALAAADGNVVPLNRPTERHRRVGAVLGVAAAVLLVLFGAAVLRGGGQSSNSSAGAPTTAAARAESAADETAAAAAATTAAAGPAAGQADASATLASPEPGGAAGGGAATPSPLPPTADSSFKAAAAPTDADLAALRDAGRRALSLPPPAVVAACPAPTPGADFAGTVLWSTGVTAELFLERRLSPPTAWALAPDSCLVLATVPLA